MSHSCVTIVMYFSVRLATGTVKHARTVGMTLNQPSNNNTQPSAQNLKVQMGTDDHQGKYLIFWSKFGRGHCENLNVCTNLDKHMR